MAKDPTVLAHQEWLGYVQPTGLVVSIPAMVDAGAVINRNFGPDHQRFLAALPQDAKGEVIPEIPDFLVFAQDVLGWDTSFILGAPGSDPVPDSLEVTLENYNETLRPTFALHDLDRSKKPLLLVNIVAKGTNLDEPIAPHDRGWQASPQARLERLLRQTSVPTGLLVSDREIRLVHAPEKELSGHITFKIAEMVQVAGRPIFAALQMLIGSERLYSVADKERLPAILADSRKYQNFVSTQLAEQVLEALYELLRGFQAANDQSKGDLLRGVLDRDPDHVYHGLLTTLLRLVFVLYAEDRGLLSTDPIYSNYYSVTGLHERLRADDGRYKDTMDQRYGAWAQLLSLFRLIYSGGSHGALRIPAREGYLFDPDRYLFLEGRHDINDKAAIPQVSDGVIYRVLSKLLLLDGERLSYRTLAVEQIGSVYQAIMGFSLRVATGRSIAIKPAKKHGAPATIDLEELLRTSADKRPKKFTEETDQKLTGAAADALKAAKTIEELLAAIERKIATTVTPLPVPKGAMVFQPSDERRKSGSHYTPSSLTGPIVEAALEPVLKQLGPKPTPAQILNLKVCDPAMGSAAFLVEACRQLGDALVEAWYAYGEIPVLPPDEDETLYAQRVVAQRCLYGLDKNPMAADLAKLSLWLATLAKDHPFTFLDHTLRHGDALVGLTRKQIGAFNWTDSAQKPLFSGKIPDLIKRAGDYRRRILDARDNVAYAQLAQQLANADEALNYPRMVGDAAIAAFFSADKPKQREEARKRLEQQIEADLKQHGFITVDGEVDRAITQLKAGPKGVHPFHWELEFPEVFTTDDKGTVTGGFDVIVGNPPFMGGIMISAALGSSYLAFITSAHQNTGNRMDYVGYFFRRTFTLLKAGGTLGLIATKTISKGDTRSGTLLPIVATGGHIYRATTRLKWPGEAQVVVSVIHILRGTTPKIRILNGRTVNDITAFLFDRGSSEDPARLSSNKGICFKGFQLSSQGFVFDDCDDFASPLQTREDLILRDSKNAELIKPYIGGEEINNDPKHEYHRYAINFGSMSLSDAGRWPDLLRIVEQKVKPGRLESNRESHARKWWQYGETRPGLSAALVGLKNVLVHSLVCTQWSLALLPADWIYSHSVNVICSEDIAMFAVLQSRVHEEWARFFGSSMKDDLRYTPTDCFETFPLPLPNEWPHLRTVGLEYYRYRASIMERRNEGLTAIYNRFHNPNEADSDILTLRKLHADMDSTVLNSYGWGDLTPSYEFIPMFEDDDDDDDGAAKKFRYRWPDGFRNDVLALILDLNRSRALDEGQVGLKAPQSNLNKTGSGKRRSAKAAGEDASLFAAERGDD